MAENRTNPYCTLRPIKKQSKSTDTNMNKESFLTPDKYDQLSQENLNLNLNTNLENWNPFDTLSMSPTITEMPIVPTTVTETTNNDLKQLNENINIYCTLKRSQVNLLPSCSNYNNNYNINTLPRLTKLNNNKENICENICTEMEPYSQPAELTDSNVKDETNLLNLSIPVYCTLPRKKNYYLFNNGNNYKLTDCNNESFEIYDILKELDIILEEHDNNNNFNLNIDNCLLDLDCYLDNLLLIDDNNYNFNNNVDDQLPDNIFNEEQFITGISANEQTTDNQLIKPITSQENETFISNITEATTVRTPTASTNNYSESLTNLNNDLFKRQHPLRNTTIGFIRNMSKRKLVDNTNRNKTENLEQLNGFAIETPTVSITSTDTAFTTTATAAAMSSGVSPLISSTIVAPAEGINNQDSIGISRNSLLSFDEPSTSSGIQFRHDPHSTWRRNSMRKTRPILLPEQIPQDSGGGDRSGFTDHFDDIGLFEQPLGNPPSYFAAIPTSRQHIPPTTNTVTTTDNYPNDNNFYEAAFGVNFYDYDNESRPRQMGRRSDIQPRVIAITAETNQNSGTQRITVCHERPTSVPISTNLVNSLSTGMSGMTTSVPPMAVTNQQQHRSSVRFINSMNNSEQSSVASSRNPSPVSLVSSTGSSGSENVADINHESLSDGSIRHTTNNPAVDDDDTVDDDPDDMYSGVTVSTTGSNSNKNIKWPNCYSRSLATVCCTIGLFNISRFAIFSVHFGANFIVQFLILSFIFGIPLIWLHMCLGSKIKQGPVKMWFISPICVGIGITLLIGQFFTAIYSSISLSWLLVYFRDSFVTNSEKYRWQEKFTLYRSNKNNSTVKLYETIGDYFNGVVLQRFNYNGNTQTSSITNKNYLGSVRFQLAFNLAIIWTFIFIILCKNLRSFGKILPLFTIIPIIGLIVILIKFLTIINISNIDNIIPSPDWDNFFINSQCWLSAAQETFLTWGLLGGTVIKIYSFTSKNIKLKKYQLRNDAIIIVFLTIFILLLASVLGTICVQILNNNGYFYLPGSYENILSYIFILPSNKPLPPQLSSIQTKWLLHYSSFVGENYQQYNYNKDFTTHAYNYNSYNSVNNNKVHESGYQVIRLITELLPTTIAIVNKNSNFSSVWCLIIFVSLLLFGIGQLCAMWLPIINLFGNYTSSVLLTCIIGLLLGIPLTTENGIVIIHYLDTLFGGAWWILLLWFGYLVAVFLIRGRPYTSDILVNDLHFTETLSAFIAFSWNVLLPIGIILLSILEYRLSNMRDFFQWRHYNNNRNYYWPLWSRQLGCLIQILILLIVPIAAIIQIYRYLSRGPPDILDRIQLLYRPKLSQHANGSLSVSTTGNATGGTTATTTPIALPLDNQLTLLQQQQQQQQDDAPPKYTPPPSYTTATGARLAKLLRNSIRRSVRRILGGDGNTQQSNRRQRPQLQQQQQQQQQISSIATYSRDNDGDAAPPDYTQIVNNNPAGGSNINATSTIEMGPRPLYNSHTMSLERRLTPFVDINLNREGTQQPHHRLTGNDVATLLRPSGNSHFVKRTASFNVNQLPPQNQPPTTTNNDELMRHTMSCLQQSRSYENLVLNAAPIGESSFIIVDSDDTQSSSFDDSRGTMTPSTANTSTDGDVDDEAKNISVI